MRAALNGLLVSAWLVVAGSAFAQTIAVAPTVAQRCLTRGELTMGAPVYPQQAFERRDTGRVAVELDFERPDTAPRVKVTASEGGPVFEKAVREFLEAYRVPCLEAGQKAQLRQEFVFKPTDGRRVRSSEPIDAEAQRVWRMSACVNHLRPSERVNYPSEALRRGEVGTVVLKLQFLDAQTPPSITVLDDVGSPVLAAAAKAFAVGFRMPCQEGGPVDFVQFFTFQIAGDARVVLTDVSFVGFLRSVKGIQGANVYFDFKEMGCPFEVRLTVNKPHGLNRVGELGEPNSERRFFLDWLRRQELNLDAKTLNAVLGQEVTLTVPCTVLNLGTKSGGGASQ